MIDDSMHMVDFVSPRKDSPTDTVFISADQVVLLRRSVQPTAAENFGLISAPLANETVSVNDQSLEEALEFGR